MNSVPFESGDIYRDEWDERDGVKGSIGVTECRGVGDRHFV